MNLLVYKESCLILTELLKTSYRVMDGLFWHFRFQKLVQDEVNISEFVIIFSFFWIG